MLCLKKVVNVFHRNENTLMGGHLHCKVMIYVVKRTCIIVEHVSTVSLIYNKTTSTKSFFWKKKTNYIQHYEAYLWRKKEQKLTAFLFFLSLLLFLKEFYLSICQFAIFLHLVSTQYPPWIKKLKVAFRLSAIFNITPYT